MTSIVSQIDFYQGRLDQCQQKIDDIDSSLKKTHLSSTNRDNLIQEKEQLASALKDHEKSLSSLRHENRRTMLVSVAILIIFVLIYILFNLN